jgi:hypothetical protein
MYILASMHLFDIIDKFSWGSTKVALKCVKEDMELFEREARILSKLRHPSNTKLRVIIQKILYNFMAFMRRVLDKNIWCWSSYQKAVYSTF